MTHVTAIIASTSGHTAFVLDTLVAYWARTAPEITVRMIRAEEAKPEDFLAGDLLVLGSGTWNTGGKEGQLNPFMHELLFDRAKSVDLKNKRVALLSLGDERYYFTTRCTEHFLKFIRDHGGKLLGMPLTITNEPYDQMERIEKWGAKLIAAML